MQTSFVLITIVFLAMEFSGEQQVNCFLITKADPTLLKVCSNFNKAVSSCHDIPGIHGQCTNVPADIIQEFSSRTVQGVNGIPKLPTVSCYLYPALECNGDTGTERTVNSAGSCGPFQSFRCFT